VITQTPKEFDFPIVRKRKFTHAYDDEAGDQ
jgi:hypothetical protein